MPATCKDYSKQHPQVSSPPSWDNIKIGCLQRIADATELMARNHAQLVADADRYKRWWNEAVEDVRWNHRRIAGLRGTITRLKRQLAEAKED